jgi:hypothetical protein
MHALWTMAAAAQAARWRLAFPASKSVGGVHPHHQKTNAAIGLWFMVG